MFKYILCFLMVFSVPVFVYAFDLSVLTPYVIQFAQEYPMFATFVFVVGWLRLNNKWLVSLLRQLILWTPTKYDDTLLRRLEKKKWWRTVAYVVDWLTSIKIESKNKTQIKSLADQKAHS